MCSWPWGVAGRGQAMDHHERVGIPRVTRAQLRPVPHSPWGFIWLIGGGVTANRTDNHAEGGAIGTSTALPNLIIPGVKKAGTTSLYQYLAQHPDICAGTQKHTNFFRSVAIGEELPSITEYGKYFGGCGTQKYRIEASTDYFEGGERLTHAMTDKLDDPHVIISLRDPVSRLWSHFRHKKRESSRSVAGLTFEKYIDRCEEMEREGVASQEGSRGYAALARGRYVDFLIPWLDTFGDDLKIVFFEQWAKNPSSALREICTWLEIDPGVVDSIDYDVKNPAGAYRSPRFARLASVTGKVGGGFLKKNPMVRGFLRSTHDAVNRQQTNESLDPETRQRLQAIYRESNRMLADELGRRGYGNLPSWLGVASP
jgi:hypothetical protein